MLEPTVQAILSSRVVLASGSPRRQEIIKNLGINAECIPSTYDENLDRKKYKSHGEYVQDLAYFKVQEVFQRLKNDQRPPELIIGADTIVTMGETIYGKPKDKADAFRILNNLKNKEHEVFSGVCLKTRNKEVKFFESAKVTFGDISEEQIRAYVATGEPMDKAGGYGIQGIGGCLIKKINGDYYTVMGMPLYSFIKHLNQLYSDN
ncbi:probable bifunctional dTTP/UTP pyrophosphatase/methyltransferase protein [Diachasma alloeum]|uniref:probable bifunctional dTTP/UTP pyrophosphatase/methyltransferase protein n=1 Tax=Diachasma alloeum TaxID=454923 RepID=UPI00073812C6|nr:probable bifunctional dTTP/UTP pyrophosphatase/methyltransferase protein [Diachasma alloeum]XP_015110260.1 probable bifunctional dTTP/UTP pyrophosphatase/methyltransferase protein [Diachasma alloeum]